MQGVSEYYMSNIREVRKPLEVNEIRSIAMDALADFLEGQVIDQRTY
jgi:hypothetical protein